MKHIETNPKQSKRSIFAHAPIVFGLTGALCMPATFTYANGVMSTNIETTQLVNQVRIVKGSILDENNEPMIGVSVMVEGTSLGTITDFDGNYVLEVPVDKTVLDISYIGYLKQSMPTPQTGSLNIKMKPDTKALDEVVVIGYGTVKKRDLTGSVSSVKEDVLLATPTTDVTESLQGRIAGLDISRSNGRDEIRIRGNRSINGSNEPLFIIDGVQGGSYSDLNPADIESIDVLKDASSTAIYGSQGANGVIIITTKKAKIGKTSVSYNGYVGVQMREEHPDFRIGEDYYNARKLAAINAGQWITEADDQSLFSSPEAYQAYRNNQWTNYEDLVMRNALQHNHQVTFAAGSEKNSSRFSLGYSDVQDNLKESHRERYFLRANIDQTITKWLKTGINFQLTYNSRNFSPFEDSSTKGLELGLPYDENGELLTYPLGNADYVNPLIDGTGEGYYSRKRNGTNVVANGYLDIMPVKGLMLRTQLSTNLKNLTDGSYTDKNQSKEINSTQSSRATMLKSNSRFVEWNNILTYNYSINQSHNFGLTGITAWTKQIEDELSGVSYDQLVSNNLWWNLGSGTNAATHSIYVQQQTSSYAGRLNYDYKSKYLLTASVRWDGSSVLATGHKWASFPSVATAWRISDENFMEGTKSWMDDLKLRATYGVTGNSGIKAYGTQSGVTASNTGLGFQDSQVLHYMFNNILGNTDTKWEKSKTIDIGFDMTMFNGRVGLVFDYYDTKTTDILLLRSLPTSSGNDGTFQLYQNIGSTRNKGIEIALNTVNVKTKQFQWSSTFTFSKNIEKITNLIDGNDIALTTEKEHSTLMIGYPVNSYRTFHYDGIYTSADAAQAAATYKDKNKLYPFAVGDIRVKDLNNDGIIDDEDDISFIGSQTPDWFAGFNNSFTYRGFDLNIYMYLRWGHWGENPAATYQPSNGGKFSSYDYWVEGANEQGSLPALYANRRLYEYKGYQSLWYCDRSFFKVKNISLGYTIPSNLIRKVGMEKMRTYFTVTNPLYKAKSDWMKGFDPEGASRSFVFGVNLNI